MTIRTMTLGGRGFAVPLLPFGINRIVYPICRKLSLAGVVERVVTDGVLATIEEDELDDLAAIGFACAQAAEPALTRAEFDALPISPIQLFDAFFYVARYQTGIWIEAEAPAGPNTGETEGAASPPTSTSTGSSPA